jgi:hypothetical protein
VPTTKSDGSIYFTDLRISPETPQQWDLTFMGVYRLSPDMTSSCPTA